MWIDAVCLNQNDKQEKARQIPRMGDIYSKAKGVLIWLGDAADDSDFFMDCVAQGDIRAYQTRRFWYGVCAVQARPWFTRKWVLQEFALNVEKPMFMCGHKAPVSYSAFLAARNQSNEWAITDERAWSDGARDHMVIMGEHMATKGATATARSERHDLRSLQLLRASVQLVLKQHMSLWSTLRMNIAQSSLCTDERDHIYGLLGLLDADHRANFTARFPVDYTKSVAMVFHEAMRFSLTTADDWSPYELYDKYVLVADGKEVPSWVPDFASTAQPNASYLPRKLDGKFTGTLKISADGRQLQTTCVPLSPVKAVVSFASAADIAASPLPMLWRLQFTTTLVHTVVAQTGLREWDVGLASTEGRVNGLRHSFSIARSLTKAYRLVCSREGKSYLPQYEFWRKLLGSEFDAHTFTVSEFEECEAIVTDPVMDQGDVEVLTSQVRSRKERVWAINKVKVVVEGASFFLCEDGTYGLARGPVHEGDQLMLLFGKPGIPFVVRDATENGEHVSMVGIARMSDGLLKEVLSECTAPMTDVVVV
jgi:hypothetical protein